MSRVVAVDLDSPDTPALVALDAELRRRHALRLVDPPLLADVLRAIDRAVAEGRVDETTADEIRDELGEFEPARVLEGHFAEIVPTRLLSPYAPAFPRHDEPIETGPEAWLRSDPTRLGDIVAETSSFTSDLKRVVEAALEVADAARIDSDLAERIILEALRTHPGESSRVG